MKKLLLTLCCTAGLLTARPAQAQLGHYLNVWYGPQLASLENENDYFTENGDKVVERVPTYRKTLGVDYAYNFHPYFGFQTGLYYSQEGQRYKGAIPYDANSPIPRVPMNYTSHVFLEYLRVPLFIRFNSDMDPEDRVNMSLFAGLQIGYLMQVSDVMTDPAPPQALLDKYPDFKAIDVFNRIDPGWAAGLQVNVRLNKGFGVFLGTRFQRGFSNVEKTTYKYEQDMPVEWSFPFSTKKIARSDVSREPTITSGVTLFAGFSFKLAGATAPTERPREEDVPSPVAP